MATKTLLSLSILILLCFNTFSLTLCKLNHEEADLDEEDLSFLDEDRNDAVPSAYTNEDHYDFENYDDLSDSFGEDDLDDSTPTIDESNVFVLKESNFSEFVKNNRYVMVEFYAPWCGHCKALTPEYAAAATELKGEAVLAKVDATEESELAQTYEIEGFPTLYFFVDGVHKPYPDQRNRDAIVAWVKKKTGPALFNLSTTEDAELKLTAESKIVLGFLDNLVGPESEELAAASKLEDDVNFYQTANPDVAKLFHVDPKGKRPALVMLKKEAEKINYFDGQFTKSAIAKFVFENKLALIINFTRESGPIIFENPIKKQLILFTTSSDSAKFIPIFREASKAFKGKVLAYTGNDDAKKFVLDSELTLSSIQSFGENFLEGNLKPFYKSDPIPETNDGDVKIVVGNNFDKIVLDESKDVLLEIYAPWCGHCQSLEPIYNKLARHLRGIDSLVIAKMDGTKNEHPRGKTDGFPTLLFFPAGNKSFDPITVDTDRTVVAFYKFLKKNASIPFKLQRSVSTQKSKASDATESHERSSDDLKDEL